MPPQQQNSSFASRLGAQVARANAEHRDKPIDTGNRRLPAGIKQVHSLAKLSSMYTKLQEKDEGGRTPKGEIFFRASASVLLPVEHNGVRTAGMVTQQIIPLCTIPAKQGDGFKSEEVPFTENWNNFQNLFKLLGVMPPRGPQYDTLPHMNEAQQAQQGMNIQAYYFAAMQSLTDPKRLGGPVYIEFSTREWKSPKRANETEEQYRNREPIIFETWHGLADPKKLTVVHPVDVANEVPSGPPTQTNGQPLSAPFEEPPMGQVVMPDEPPNVEDEVAALVEASLADPDGATEDGKLASARLEDMAWSNGWTKDQTKAAADWGQVGEMALDTPKNNQALVNLLASQAATTQPASASTPEVGSKWKYTSRGKDGNKLKDKDGKDVMAKDVEVVTVNVNDKTCTLKDKNGKDVADFRTRKPVAVKWEWLEPA